MREESVKILRENDNLDLSTYKPFMQEFYKFSGDMFDFESNIFQQKKKDPTQLLEANLRRSLKNEYRLVEKDHKFQENGAPSPERINKLLKKYPPFQQDNVLEEDIMSFQKKGEIGWNFITNQVLQGQQFEEKIQEMQADKERKRLQVQRA